MSQSKCHVNLLQVFHFRSVTEIPYNLPLFYCGGFLVVERHNSFLNLFFIVRAYVYK